MGSERERVKMIKCNKFPGKIPWRNPTEQGTYTSIMKDRNEKWV
jgi:hypothetical protein